MVATAVERKAPDPTSRRAALRRWFRLSGVAPIGVFLVLHLWTGLSALTSREAYDAQLVAVNAIPAFALIEIVFVLLPLAFHALFGLHLALRPDPEPHAYASDGLHLLQRVTGLVAFAFVVLHLWHLRVQALLGHVTTQGFASRLEQDLASTSWGIPWIALGYTVGLAACTFHLANGMTSFWRRRGLGSARAATAALSALGLLLFLGSFAVVVQLATGTRVLGAPTPPDPGKNAACGPSVATALPSARP